MVSAGSLRAKVCCWRRKYPQDVALARRGATVPVRQGAICPRREPRNQRVALSRCGHGLGNCHLLRPLRNKPQITSPAMVWRRRFGRQGVFSPGCSAQSGQLHIPGPVTCARGAEGGVLLGSLAGSHWRFFMAGWCTHGMATRAFRWQPEVAKRQCCAGTRRRRARYPVRGALVGVGGGESHPYCCAGAPGVPAFG